MVEPEIAWMTERAAGELAALQGVDVAAARTTAAGLDWLWTPDALVHDGWRDLGDGRWVPVPADERDEWMIPTRGEYAGLEDVGAPAAGSEAAGGAVARGDEMAAAHRWMDAWSGPDGWRVRHAARMQTVGRMVRLAGVLNEEVEMAKVRSRGLVVSAAARRSLSERAATFQLPPERYLEQLLLTRKPHALDELVDDAIEVAMQRRRKARAGPPSRPAAAESTRPPAAKPPGVAS